MPSYTPITSEDCLQCSLREEDSLGAITNHAILSLIERLSFLRSLKYIILVRKKIWRVLERPLYRVDLNTVPSSEGPLREVRLY